MKLTILVVTVACLMGAMLALTIGPQPEPGGETFVSDQPSILDE
ncbi:MAG: hypothetical protein WD557_11625 [Dehalococcoidia bacterium]